jgi:hypothetical protein
MTSSSVRAKLIAVIATLLIAILLGPIFGLASIWMLPEIAMLINNLVMDPLHALDSLPAHASVFAFMIPFSYLLGGIQAAIAGIIFASIGLRIGNLPPWSIVPASAIPFGAFVAWDLWKERNALSTGSLLDGLLLFAPVHLTAAIIVYFCVRPFWTFNVRAEN